MTVYDVTPVVIYTLTGIAEYPFTFRIFDESDLAVIHIDLDSEVTTLVLNTDYSVTIYEDGDGIITLLDTSLVGQLSIARDLPVTQEVNWVNNDPLDMVVQENSFDKLTMLIQEIEAAAVSYPPGFPPTVEFPLPSPEAVIGWSSDGTTLENYPSYGSFQTLHDEAVSAAAAAALSASNASDSETAAALSASNASDSETAAATSEANAASSASDAQDAETAAELAQAQAESAQLAAEVSEGNAAIWAQESANCAQASYDSAVESATSASEAATSADEAAASAATIDLPELGVDMVLPDDIGKGIVVVDDAGSPAWGKSDITINERSENSIINPIFTNWQRYDGSTPFITNYGYCADRKMLRVFSGADISVTPVSGIDINGNYRSKYGCAVAFTDAGGVGGASIEERILDVGSIHNGPATINILANIPIGNSVAMSMAQYLGVADGSISIPAEEHLVGTGVPTVYTIYRNLPSVNGYTIDDDSYLQLRFHVTTRASYDATTFSLGNQPDGTIIFYAWQIRPGIRDGIFEVPNKTTDRDRCFDFFQRFGGSGVQNERFGVGHWYSTTIAWYKIDYKKAMRSPPQISAYLPVSSFKATIAGGSQSPTSLASLNIGTKTCLIQADVASGGITNNPSFFTSDNSGSAYLDFDCEL